MRFNLVYNNSGDTIEFETKYNSELIHWFIEQANQKNYNNFLISNTIATFILLLKACSQYKSFISFLEKVKL